MKELADEGKKGDYSIATTERTFKEGEDTGSM